MLTRQQHIEAQNILAQLNRDWHHDRARQQIVPLRHAWRGCLGLALMVNRFDDYAIACGEQTVLPNHAVTWLALRDFPPGHCPGDATMDFRGACIASTTRAVLAYGMPTIDFTRTARDDWDFKRRPMHSGVEGGIKRPDVLDARFRAREWAVLNRMSAAMTNFAVNARDHRGHPIRPAWCSRFPDLQRPYAHAPTINWFPRAYLAFKRNKFRYRNVSRRSRDTDGIPTMHLNSGVTLVSASGIGHSKQPVAPLSMWWDVSECAHCLDVDLEAFIFPPLHLAAFHSLRKTLPGDVQLQASFGVHDRAKLKTEKCDINRSATAA